LIKAPEASEIIKADLLKIESPYHFAQPLTHDQFEKASYERLII
jgi:hypothetical protein